MEKEQGVGYIIHPINLIRLFKNMNLPPADNTPLAKAE